MKKYNVINANDCDYTLRDETKGTHKISLQFYDVVPPQIGETISLSEKLFDTKFTEGVTHFHFGKFTEKYGKNITRENMNEHMDEIMIIERGNEKYYLKRLYG